MKPILILALNPSMDAEWRVADVRWEEKNNVQSERRWAGGKGINVARWLKHLGAKPRLLLPLGGTTGAELAGHLRGERILFQIIPLREPTRVNVIVTTDGGRQIRLNPLGPKLSRAELGRLRAEFEQRLESAGLLILSGSLPRGVPVTIYAQFIRLARALGVRTLLDCDGLAFAAAVQARPFLVKPNEHELAQWWRKPIRSEAGVVHAAHALSAQTHGWVLISRGAKRGLLVNHARKIQFTAAPPRLKPRNTVGAGDALLAAVAWQIQLGEPPEQWLKVGLKTGSAATQRMAGRL